MAEGPLDAPLEAVMKLPPEVRVHRLRGDASERAFRLGCAPDTGKPAAADSRMGSHETAAAAELGPVAVAGVRLQPLGGGPCPVPAA